MLKDSRMTLLGNFDVQPILKLFGDNKKTWTWLNK
jgi:hypothetical protein